MALDSPVTYEKKTPSLWTREQRVVEAVRMAQKTGGDAISGGDITDLLAILTAVDDYAKGSATSMNAIRTNYQTWLQQPNTK